MAVELIEVPLSDRKLVDRFIRVQWWIHREHHPSDHWVPPLMMDRRDFLNPVKNPFFEHADCRFWLARKNGRDVGRVAAVNDHDWQKHHGTATGYFGMFDTPDDPEVASALLDAAMTWLADDQGREDVVGPFDLSTNYVAGLLVDAFDRDPGMQMPYNPPYCAELIEGAGFAKAKDLWQWEVPLDQPVAERVARVADKIRKRARVDVRNMVLADWDNEVTRILEIYNDAWEDNWGFVPVGEKEFRHIATDLKMVVDPAVALMAEVDGDPVAFSITIKDINPILKKVDGKLFPTGLLRLLWDLKVRSDAVTGCRLIVLGIKSGYRRRGIDSILFVETFRGAKQRGWSMGQVGWTLEDNDMVNRALESMNGERISTYRVFRKEL